MRQRAAESDVVIVNHHLLCADAAVRQSAFGEVIPTCRFAIVDEAHQLEDVATQYFGLSVSNYRVDDFVRDVDRALGAARLPTASAPDRSPTTRERIADTRARRSSPRCRCCGTSCPGAGGAGDNRVRVRAGADCRGSSTRARR